MATAVKIFAHRGVVQAPVTTLARDSRDSVYMLEQPYLAAEALTASGSAVSSSPATTPVQTGLMRIEVEDGKSIRYEMNPPGRSANATANSPGLSGRDQFHCGAGWTISVIEA
jgi:hypothetical protein